VNYTSTQIQTTDDSTYIRKLCRHFAHKVPVVHTELEAQVQFLQGPCIMKADARSLSIYMQTDAPDGIRAMQFIIDDHLQRFVRFETLSYQWGSEVPVAIKPELAVLTKEGRAQ
jgi:hypothetical protein